MVLAVSLFHSGVSRAQAVHASANKVKAEANRVKWKNRSLRKWSPRGQQSAVSALQHSGSKGKETSRVKRKDSISEVTIPCYLVLDEGYNTLLMSINSQKHTLPPLSCLFMPLALSSSVFDVWARLITMCMSTPSLSNTVCLLIMCIQYHFRISRGLWTDICLFWAAAAAGPSHWWLHLFYQWDLSIPLQWVWAG